MVPDLPVKVVFARNRHNKGQWLALLSTDCSLSAEEIIRTYGMRWKIETFFKGVKSRLRLQKKFHGRSYDLMISHTTIVFARYIVLSWHHRLSTDGRSFGGLFLAMCDEAASVDWTVALQQLLQIFRDLSLNVSKSLKLLIKSQLQHWIASLPSYIDACLPICDCES